MKNTILDAIRCIQRIEYVQDHLQKIGWDVYIMGGETEIESVVLDLLSIPKDREEEFIRDMYYEAFCSDKSAEQVFDELVKIAEEAREEYKQAGIELPDYSTF